MDSLLFQSVLGLVTCYVLGHVLCQVTYFLFDHVGPGYLMA